MTKSLAVVLKESETIPYLMMGPPCPDNPDWIYRDFRPMLQSMWLELIDLLGEENIRICAANTRQLPPAEMCRAQIWINPKAQELWKDYLQKHGN